jgi:hypothetical protein
VGLAGRGAETGQAGEERAEEESGEEESEAARATLITFVMAGLVLAIHVGPIALFYRDTKPLNDVDPRDKPGDDVKGWRGFRSSQ